MCINVYLSSDSTGHTHALSPIPTCALILSHSHFHMMNNVSLVLSYSAY